MEIKFFSNININNLKEQITAFEKDESINGILLLVCDKNNYNSEILDPILTYVKKPIFGGIFPAIIFEKQKHETGFIIVGLNVTPIVNCIKNISSAKTNIESEVIKLSNNHIESKTMFIFIDGFAERINAFIESIFTIFGLEYNYIGGGAGSLSLKQKPCIISNNGLIQDSVVIASISLESGIGVQHGWKTISGPFKVTSSEKTIINELDHKPAYDIYKEVIENHTKLKVDRNNFFNTAKAFPFGINKIDAEKVVRDPLLIGENNSLICVGEVEKGSFVDILTGDKKSLVQAAKRAMNLALENKKGKPEHFIFFVDCISRVLFLEKDFTKEIEAVNAFNKNLPFFGVLTIGEIANNGKDYLEFYNKTSVIGCF